MKVVGKIETVKVKRKNATGGYVVINTADLKPGDKVYEEGKRDRRRNPAKSGENKQGQS